MRDIVQTADTWRAAGRRFAIATVVKTWGSSPRPLGASMAIRDDGFIVGSVSGGCVEGAVQETALKCLQSGEATLLKFDSLSNDDVWRIGLSCGGSIHVWVDPNPVERDPTFWSRLVDAVRREEPCALITYFDPVSQVLAPTDGMATHALEDEIGFVQVLGPLDELIIVGAVHIAIPLTALAKMMGFRVLLIDPRSNLVTAERFPSVPDEFRTQWPAEALADLELNENTYAVVLTHDPKIDDAALEVFLRSKVRYIGALGSRKTQEKRRADLADLGFSAFDLARIHGPIGLSIGAQSPEEIALSIMAQIISVRHAPH